LAASDVIVDGLFGIGLQRPISGVYAEMIQVANNSQVPILALDIPSGLHADTGMPQGETIKAAVTATFIAEKNGLINAASYTGKIILCNLQLPDHIMELI